MFLRREQHESGNGYFETLRLDLRLVKPSTSAIVLFLDGGPRHFQSLQSVLLECHRIQTNKTYSDYLPTEDDNDNKKGPMFEVSGKARKNYMGLAMCVLYKDGWNREKELPIWGMRVFLEPLFVSTLKEKQDRCMQLIINAVPALEKFKPRLFASVREICAALSSHSLPKLKKKFLRTEEGLPIGPFVDTIFKQLYETFPKIVEESESAYAVAMLQEMFHQIDYNGDGSTNWDEFTTFCVSTGLNVTVNKKALDNNNDSQEQSLDQYVIEYGEEVLQRDRILSAYRLVSVMRYVPDTRKIYIISEDADNILMLDEKYRLHAQLYPSKIQIPGPGAASSTSKNAVAAAAALAAANGGAPPADTGSAGTGSGMSGADALSSATEAMKNTMKGGSFPRVMVYDVCYLTGRDLIAFTSSDHSITIVREMATMGANKTYFVLHNKFFHTLLHLKLCWSQKYDLLCTTASDRVIYGWNIDTAQIIFQVSRHSDIITDFLAADHMDVFITSSMDKRIVMWSATSRRVKGILLGHKRGVRCLSMFENLLLSAGFECDARLWDLNSKDCISILRGHRHPITAARLMCERAHSDKDYRAISVDESGEFRLWNIYVRERTSEPMIATTLQMFEMQNVEYPINQFRFLALPYNSKASTSYYSDIIACSTKLLHFVPEKNTKEFVPPTACVCNEASAVILTAAGRSLLTYDLSSGTFVSMFDHVVASDIFALCMDGERGRRVFVGTAKGEVVLLNTATGQYIDSLHYHTKEITDLVQRFKDGRNCVFSCGADGHVRMYEESGGRLTLNNSCDHIFGEGVGLLGLRVVPSLQVLVVASVHETWGIFAETSLKKLMVFTEEEIIMAVEVIGATKDKDHEEMIGKWMKYGANSTAQGLPPPPPDIGSQLKDHLLTLAIAMSSGIVVYTIDLVEQRGVRTFHLQHDWPIYITSLIYLRNPDMTAVNYSSVRSKASTGEGIQMVAVTDEGKLVIWDVDQLRFSSESLYRQYFKLLQEEEQNHHHRGRHAPKRRVQSAHAKATPQQRSPEGSPTGAKAQQAFDFAPNATSTATVSTPSGATSSSATAAPAAAATATATSGVNAAGNGNSAFLTAPGAGDRPQSSTKPVSPRHQPQPTRTWMEGPSAELLPIAATLLAAMSSRKQSSGGSGAGHRRQTRAQHQQQLQQQRSFNAAVSEMNADGTPSTPSHGGGGNAIISTPAARIRHASMSTTFGQYLIRSTMMYSAHSDTIPKVVALPTNSCLVTVSHDGFHRLWNVDMEILGELQLPNITEQMKQTAMCVEVGTQWKFILERIPVTTQHQEIAHGIVRSIKATKQEKLLEYQRQQQQQMLEQQQQQQAAAHKNSVAYQRRDAAQLNASMVKSLSSSQSDYLGEFDALSLSSGFPGGSGGGGYGLAGASAQPHITPEQQEQWLQQQRRLQEDAEKRSKIRSNMLTALCAPPVEVNENRPPLRLPTKEEKDLIKMTLMSQMEHQQLHSSHGHSHPGSPTIRPFAGGSGGDGGLDAPSSWLSSSATVDEDGKAGALGIGEAAMSTTLSVSKSLSALPSGATKAGKQTAKAAATPVRVAKQQQQQRGGKRSTTNVSPARINRQGQVATATASPNHKAQRRGPLSPIATGASTSVPFAQESTATLATVEPRATSPPLFLTQEPRTASREGSPYNRRAKSPDPKQIAALTSTLRSSVQFHASQSKHGNDMCMSSFGLPSLWVVPGEKDIFGRPVPIGGSNLTDTEKDKTPLPSQTIAPAFSEASIVALHRENLIDNEGMRILRQVASKVDRVQVYDRSQPTLLVRNPSMSTSVTLPPLEQVKKTEILFGAQKDLYKNAEKVLAEKHDMSNKYSIRGAVAIARIEQNLRRVNSMIHLIAPPNHDEVILPGTSEGSRGGAGGDGSGDNSGLDVMGEAGSKGLLTKDNEEAMMKLRLSRSDKLVSPEARARFGRPLDPQAIKRWTSKMEDALDITADSLATKAQDNARKRQRKKKETISPAMLATLEKKLSQAIKGKYFSRMAKVRKQQLLMEKHAKPANETGEVVPLTKEDEAAAATNAAHTTSSSGGGLLSPTLPSPQQQITRAASMLSINSDDNNGSNHDFDDPDGELAAGIAALTANNKERKVVNLTTRELLPYYKLETVIQFMDIFAKVDENFSGDLDVNEWIRLFTSLNESVPVQEARMIFMKIDKDGDGYLSMRELIPVVFGKATRAQQKKIIEFCEFELTKKIETETIPTVTLTDLDFIFEAYDSENVGFVDVSVIRERIRKMPLNDQQIFFFMELIADLADDEMVNLLEFRRIFRIFTKNK